MYIDTIKVSNILRFHDKSSVDIAFSRPGGQYAGWTVLAGRNGSGDTSQLRCVALAIAGPKVAPRIIPSYLTWRFDNRIDGEISAELYLDDQELKDVYDVAAPPPPGLRLTSRLTISTAHMDVAQRRMVQIEKWNSQFDGHGVDDSIGSGSVDDYLRAAFFTRHSFAAGYGPFRYLSADGGEPQSPSPENGGGDEILERAERFASLFREDVSLSASIAWLVKLQHRALEKRRGAAHLLDVTLRLLSDGLLPKDYQIERVDSAGLWVTYHGKTFPLRELSDGHRTVTALLLDIARGLHEFYGKLDVRRDPDERISIRSPGIVLIDEIDAHMHVTWQKEIGGWLKRHFPRIQFIVTTHSPYICQAADPGGLIRLPGPDEHTGPAHVSDALYNRIVFGSGDDAVLSELFGLESPYSDRAEDMRRQLIALEEKVFSGNATKREEDAYRAMSETLTSSVTARGDEVSARLRRSS